MKGFAGRPHIFNLGHGILPETPIAHVERLVARLRGERDMLLWIKAAHILAVISWMAGLLYLPRLFVYHAGTQPGSPQSETFKVMERRLLKAIMNPAMIASWLLGLWLAYEIEAWRQGWFHGKLALVLALSACHGFLAGKCAGSRPIATSVPPVSSGFSTKSRPCS